MPNLYKKLAWYEDAEESGLLVRLPCKVGATIYFVVDKCEQKLSGCPRNGGYTRTRCNKNGKYYEYCGAYIDKAKFTLPMLESVGKTIFLTREEAEKALEAKR